MLTQLKDNLTPKAEQPVLPGQNQLTDLTGYNQVQKLYKPGLLVIHPRAQVLDQHIGLVLFQYLLLRLKVLFLVMGANSGIGHLLLIVKLGCLKSPMITKGALAGQLALARPAPDSLRVNSIVLGNLCHR